jgi:flagellar FliJ protein
MAAFRFRLEPILKLKKLRQEQMERKVAQCVGEMLKTRQQLDRLDGQIEQLYENIRRSGLVGPLQIGNLIGDRRYLNHLHRLRDHQRTLLAKTIHLVDQAKKGLAEAKKETDIMVKLKEQAHRRFMDERRRKETALLDDLANAKHAWQRQVSN